MNGRTFKSDANAGESLNLIRIQSDTHEIQQTIASAGDIQLFVRATFVLNAFHTMLRNVVVVVTQTNVIQMELSSEAEALRLYNISVRNSMNRRVSMRYFFNYNALSMYTRSFINSTVFFSLFYAVLLVRRDRGFQKWRRLYFKGCKDQRIF